MDTTPLNNLAFALTAFALKNEAILAFHSHVELWEHWEPLLRTKWNSVEAMREEHPTLFPLCSFLNRYSGNRYFAYYAKGLETIYTVNLSIEDQKKVLENCGF